MNKILDGKVILYTVKDIALLKREGFDPYDPKITDFKGTKQEVMEACLVGYLQLDNQVYLLKYRDGEKKVVSLDEFWDMAAFFEKGISYESFRNIIAACNL